MKRIVTLTAGLLTGLLLTGCSTTPERVDPYALPEYAEPDKACHDLTGRYRALPHVLGEGQQDERPLLAQTLLPEEETLSAATTVELVIGNDASLWVRADSEDGKHLASRRYAVDSGVFECDDGQLEFYPQALGEKTAGVGWEKVILRKTTDGSLMLRKGGLFSGLVFMVLPMYVSTEDWYLFKPATP